MDDALEAWAKRNGVAGAAVDELKTMFSMGDASVSDSWLDGSVSPEAPASQPHRTLGRLGAGGMGEVLQVYDERLRRVLALKVLHPSLASRAAARTRFLAEAQITAQLQHPGIVPVHEIGELPDGRPYFTMLRISGHTLRAEIGRLHAGETTLRAVLGVVRRVCEAVAYAHTRGVVHRDLKPDNVMVGAFGQVHVLDWGLASVRARPELEPWEQVHTERDGVALTRVGRASGTPRYMAPEQARGELADERSDVFALGLILYEVLEGTSARESSESLDVLANAPIPTLSDAHDSGLTAICHRAVALEPDARYADATTLERALSAWLDGAVRRAEAEALIRVADGHERAARTLTAESERVRAQGRAALDGVPGHASVTDKAPGWRALEEAAQLAARADTEAWDRIVQLEASLTRDPGNREALAALAALHRDAHAAAVVAHDDEAAKRHLRQLRRFDRGEHAAYLAGTGALTLVTDTPARVTLQRLALEDRRLQPGPAEVLGTTPMVERPLEMGSYLLTLEADGREPVRYPVHIGREQHRHGRPPGAREPAAVVLPARLDRDEVYVPAGWFVAGIHKPIPGCQPERAEWVDGLVFQRDPVTNRAYLAFLDDLVRMGREDEALRWVPRERASRPGELGAMCYGRRDDGGFALVPDADGDLWDPDWPVFLVSWHAATAYASWYADKTGRPWQLPPELAWEKAARGVDGREFPWGPYVDPAFASVRGSQPGRPMPATVDAFPLDVSIYGVRGMAGNVREWCADRFAEGSDERVLRGGCWFFASTGARCAGRYALAPGNRGDTVGFRIARPLRDG